MSRRRKYPKVTGSWTYGHIVPENLIYIGSSDRPECHLRWKPSDYESTELQPYIEKHGWDNIKHIVFKDGLTPKQAKQLEDLLITQAKIDGWCLNKKGSGLECRDNPKEYRKQYNVEHKDERRKYYEDHREDILESRKQYYEDHREDILESRKQYRKDHQENIKEYYKEYYKSNKERWVKPENLIYKRVQGYNRYHEPIETPLEAKQKYLETAYIPNYIKNDDLRT